MNKQLEVYLIRHTQPLIERGICYGQLDCELSSNYREQRNKISHYFKDKEITSIVSSPLKRCARLAEDLAKLSVNNSPVHYKNAFKEIDFGDWEGQKWDEIPRNNIDTWDNDRLHFQFPNGETPLQFHSRVIKAWSELVESQQRNTAKKLLFIAHAGVIRSILCHCLHIPFQYSTQLAIEYGSISTVNLQYDSWICHGINYLPN